MSTGVRPVVLMPEVATKNESRKGCLCPLAEEIGSESKIATVVITNRYPMTRS
jgi:hypothetical protein